MHLPTRLLPAITLTAISAALMVGVTAARAQDQPPAFHVLFVDNGASSRPPGNAQHGSYTFAPTHFAVVQGQQIVFDNPATARWPHSVESLVWTGQSNVKSITPGALFDSSPTPDLVINQGDSWTLDTSMLEPGQYAFYCYIHPWMVGSFSLQAAGS
ncbi:MAG: copper-binding protein [Chloroflexi bacterium]|nr:copper-binding protein [Chloroflexota bacterium]